MCGQIPKSRVFCEPVRRLRPRTTASPSSFTPGESSSRQILAGAPDARDRPVTAATPERSPRNAFDAWSNDLRRWREKHPCDSVPLAQSRSAHTPASKETAVVAGNGQLTRRRSKIAGPASFARGERLYASDEPRRREENFGKHAVRLPTAGGDVVVILNRCRANVGELQNWVSPLRARTAGNKVDETASEVAPESALRGEARNESPICARRASTTRLVHQQDGGLITVQPKPSVSRCISMGNGYARTPQANAAALLPDHVAPVITYYREPGRAELPVLFCGTTAPMIRATRSRSCPSSSSPKHEVSCGDNRGGDYPESVEINAPQRRTHDPLCRKSKCMEETALLQGKPSRDAIEDDAYEAIDMHAVEDVASGKSRVKGIARVPNPRYTSSVAEGSPTGDEEVTASAERGCGSRGEIN